MSEQYASSSAAATLEASSVVLSVRKPEWFLSRQWGALRNIVRIFIVYFSLKYLNKNLKFLHISYLVALVILANYQNSINFESPYLRAQEELEARTTSAEKAAT